MGYLLWFQCKKLHMKIYFIRKAWKIIYLYQQNWHFMSHISFLCDKIFLCIKIILHLTVSTVYGILDLYMSLLSCKSYSIKSICTVYCINLSSRIMDRPIWCTKQHKFHITFTSQNKYNTPQTVGIVQHNILMNQPLSQNFRGLFLTLIKLFEFLKI